MYSLKHLTLLFLLQAVTGNILSQPPLLPSHNNMRHGDVLDKHRVSFENLNLGQNGFLIDLSNADISGKTFSQTVTSTADNAAMMSIERGNRTYFMIRNDSTVIYRTENNLEYIDYDLCETWLKLPTGCGDSISGTFHGIGRYCDKLSVERFGRYVTCAESTGTVILPDGTRMDSCLCLHTVRLISVMTAPADSVQTPKAHVATDSIDWYMSVCPPAIREDIHRIYAVGYRYPILELYDVSSCHPDSPALPESHAFYCPPDMQVLLYDTENGKTRKVRETAYGSDTAGSAPHDGGVIYSMMRNEGERKLYVTLKSPCDTNVDLTVADIRGIIYRKHSVKCTAGNTVNVEVEYSGLRRGEYALRVCSDGGYDYSEKLIVR